MPGIVVQGRTPEVHIMAALASELSHKGTYGAPWENKLCQALSSRHPGPRRPKASLVALPNITGGTQSLIPRERDGL